MMSGINFQTGQIDFIQPQNLLHNFDCPSTFETFVAKSKMKILPNLNLELVEFDLDGLNSMQIIMPILSDFHTLSANFQNMGFQVLDALHSVEFLPKTTIIFPSIFMQIKSSLKDSLQHFGLSRLFKEKNSDFGFKVNILDVLQFNTMTIFPRKFHSKFEHNQSSAIIINRPFIFRILNKIDSQPKLIGFISCPKEDGNVEKCFDIRSNCEKHNFCNRLDDICNLWSQCNK